MDVELFNPLLHRLILDQGIIFLFLENIEKKSRQNLSKVLYTFENISENGAMLWKIEHLLQRSKHSIFHNIFKYFVFQRHQKALSWSKGLNVCFCSY